MSDEIVELFKTQHKEAMEVARNQTRLLELWTAEDRVNNVRLAMVEDVLKKILITGGEVSKSCKDLLQELSR